MIQYDLKIERYIQNLSIEAKDQVIRFLLCKDDIQNSNKGFVLLQVEEMARMYPEFNSHYVTEN